MIVFVRHGETSANRDGLLLGRSDPPLTARGRGQARAVAAAVATTAATRVVSSPLRRARETADEIASALQLEVELDDRLIEVSYGAWEARRLTDVSPTDAGRWRADTTFAPPGGESLQVVGARMASFCEEHIGGATVIAVSHVSPVKAAVTWALGVGEEVAWRMFLDLASITRIAERNSLPCVLTLNETAHLAVAPGGGPSTAGVEPRP